MSERALGTAVIMTGLRIRDWLDQVEGAGWRQRARSWIIVSMSWSAVSATVLPLAGVVLGPAGTLLGQRFATRVDVQRDAALRAAAQRAERKDAIIGFLSAAERMELLRGKAADGHLPDGAETGELIHALWLAKKVIGCNQKKDHGV
jgi:hypothetical protein